MIEPQNVIDLGAAPAINRLVVIADAADVFLLCADVPASGVASSLETALVRRIRQR